MKLTLLTRYSRLGASSRLRTFQYIPALEAAGFQIDLAPFFDDDYLVDLYSGRRKTVRTLGYYSNRVSQCLAARQADVIWIEKEALPWVPWAMERALIPRRVPYVVDFDDAIFHRYDQHPSPIARRLLGQKIDRLMRASACVTAGNAYLAARAEKAGAPRIETLPTVVDLGRYEIARSPTPDGALRVGWIGTPKTWEELARPIMSVLAPTLKEAGATFCAVGADLNASRVNGLEIVPWSEATEVAAIQRMDIGVMPLPDSPWTRGKCGYKLIQYMACGLPVIASPVGVNVEIVEHGVSGFLAATKEDWEKAVNKLLGDPDLRRQMGNAGRKKVERQYSLQKSATRLVELLKETALVEGVKALEGVGN